MWELSILDHQDELRRIDKSNMLGRYMGVSESCRDAVQRARQISIPNEVSVSKEVLIKYGKPHHLIVAGMGGSAIGGEILRDWLREELPIPLEVSREYALPAYANENTLVVVVSYSGNTEETLSSFVDAICRRCMIIAITSGGLLRSFCEGLGIPYVKVPNGFTPRGAIPYLFFPLPILMEKTGILRNRVEDIEETVSVLKKLGEENSYTTPTQNNLSKKMALELMGTIPVVYGFRHYGAIAHRLTTQFNENSKVPSKYAVFPEMNHNEVVGWEAPKGLTGNFSVVLIRDPDEPPEIRHRIDATKLLNLHKVSKVLEIFAKGRGKLAKMFSILYVGDLVSIYLAILQKIDPAPVRIIGELKSELTKRINVIERLKGQLRQMTEKVL